MGAGSVISISIHTTLKLNKGDQISIVLTNGQIYDDTFYYSTQFTGTLLEEELIIS